MIIQCESCETRFRLDQTRIPLEGTRVRCSRCKMAFFVPHPNDSAPEGTDEVVAEATEPPRAADPSPSQDLFDAGGSDLGRTVSTGAASGSEPEPEDEQWEFEDDVKPAPPPPPVAAAAPEPEAPELFSQEPPAPESETPQSGLIEDFGLDLGESSLDLGDESLEKGAPDPTPAPFAGAPPALDDAPAADLSAPAHSAPAEASSIGVGFDPDESGLDPMAGPDPVEQPSAPPPQAASAESFGELGSPEDWDFLADSSEALARTAEFTEEGQPGVAPPPVGSSAAEPAFEDADVFPEEGAEDAPAAVMADSTLRASLRARISQPWFAVAGNSIGWFAAVALLVIGISQALIPAPPRGLAVAEPRTFSLPLGEAREVRGHFIDNAWAGPLFVVQGHYEPNESPRGPVKLTLRWLDAEGRPLRGAQNAVAGAGLEPDELRELRPEAAAALLAHASPDFRFGGLFDVVPGSVPDGAADFDLVFEAVPAPPASPAEEATPEEASPGEAPPAEAGDAVLEEAG